jgi:hypothetical protein
MLIQAILVHLISFHWSIKPSVQIGRFGPETEETELSANRPLDRTGKGLATEPGQRPPDRCQGDRAGTGARETGGDLGDRTELNRGHAGDLGDRGSADARETEETAGPETAGPWHRTADRET